MVISVTMGTKRPLMPIATTTACRTASAMPISLVDSCQAIGKATHPTTSSSVTYTTTGVRLPVVAVHHFFKKKCCFFDLDCDFWKMDL
jgi:hypothetical protein